MKYPYWTKQETDYLRDNYKKNTNQELAAILGKSRRGIHLKAHRIGLLKGRGGAGRAYSRKEDRLIIRCYPVLTLIEISKLLGARIPYSVGRRVDRLIEMGKIAERKRKAA